MKATEEGSGASAPRNPRSPLPSAVELDAHIERMADEYLALPRAVRDGAAVVYTIALSLSETALLQLLAVAGALRRG
jgi:hypothetical protein